MSIFNSNMDLTKGPIAKSILIFAVPLLISSVIQQLYSTVDLLFVGNVLGTNASAALGISSLLINCLVNFFIGISTGVTVAIGHLFGAKDKDGIVAANRSSLAFAVIAGLAVALFGYLFSPVYLELMETPDEVLSDAQTYLNLYFIAMIAVVLYNVAAGSLRAVGDSFTPLIAQAIGGGLNVAMNFILLCLLHSSIGGVAVATLVSNGTAAAITISVLTVKGYMIFPGTKAYREETARGRKSGMTELKKVLAVGIPVGLQSMTITLANIIAQHQIDLLSVDAIAAYTVYFKVELVIYYAIMAIGQATTAFVSQNHGAGDHERMKRGANICQAMGLIISAALSVIMLAVGYWAFWIFNQDPDVIAIGQQIIAITFPFYFLYSVLEIQGDTIRGLGHSVVPAFIVFFNICVLRTVLILAITANGVTVGKIAMCYPISWASTSVCMIIARIYYDRKHGHTAHGYNYYHDHDEDADQSHHPHEHDYAHERDNDFLRVQVIEVEKGRGLEQLQESEAASDDLRVGLADAGTQTALA